jgi:glycosyltransferase involved in cell wall biosynthesis
MPASIAVIIPCYNEAPTIAEVISHFKRTVPEADIYVFDNNSTDKTIEIAKSSGAEVIKEKRQGKGFVVQSMFNRIDADIYIMVDADNTYDISRVNEMISMVLDDKADMVVGNRLKTFKEKSFKPFHIFGNHLVKFLINKLFKTRLSDIMSGFRVMSRAFVKNINVMSPAFEVETEMTIKALKYGYIIKEVDVEYGERPEGSCSKLHTVKDGVSVIKTIFIIFKDYKPLFFFSVVSLILFLVSLVSGSVVITEFIETRYITHVPLAVFASGTGILSIIVFATGIVLDSVNKRFDELTNCVKNKK